MPGEIFYKPNAARLSDTDAAPKLLGADVELGNFILGMEREYGTAALAARALLREVDGLPMLADSDYSVPGPSELQATGTNPQDWGRKYLSANGGCVYIDLDHLECCTPEVLSAYDFAAAWHAMLRIVRSALRTANTRLPDGLKIVVLVNNQDGQGHSYGTHLNVQVTRAAWERLFHRRVQQQLLLASLQVSSIILTGQGKAVSERENADRGRYELSQRASFFKCLVGPQTTCNRPLVNSRDEALCGRFTELGCPADRLARHHSIFFDATLCPGSIVLRAGLMQLWLSVLERGSPDSYLGLMLEDPLEAVTRWSCDPTLTAGAGLLTGEEVTALELQRRFLDHTARFVGGGGCDGIVPAASEIVALWADTLDKLSRRDFGALAGRLDWVLKLQLLERAVQQNPELDWSSPEIRHLDFKYSDLDEGLFWACQQAGAVEALGVTEEQIRKFTQQPPSNTRAWTRAHLLRLADPATVAEVDWDRIMFKFRSPWGAETRRTVSLANPLGFTRRDTQAVFRGAGDLNEALDLLGAPDHDPEPVSATGQYWLWPGHQASRPARPLPNGGNEFNHEPPS